MESDHHTGCTTDGSASGQVERAFSKFKAKFCQPVSAEFSVYVKKGQSGVCAQSQATSAVTGRLRVEEREGGTYWCALNKYLERWKYYTMFGNE